MSAQPDPLTHTDETIRITEIVPADGRLDGHVFTRCHINGPALIFLDGGVFQNNHLPAPLNGGLWEMPRQTKVYGAIHAHWCTFDGCWFNNVGFTGLSGTLADIQKSTD